LHGDFKLANLLWPPRTNSSTSCERQGGTSKNDDGGAGVAKNDGGGALKGAADVDRPLVKGAADVDRPLVKGAADVDRPLVKGAADVDRPLVKGAADVERPLVKGAADVERPLVIDFEWSGLGPCAQDVMYLLISSARLDCIANLTAEHGLVAHYHANLPPIVRQSYPLVQVSLVSGREVSVGSAELTAPRSVLDPDLCTYTDLLVSSTLCTCSPNHQLQKDCELVLLDILRWLLCGPWSAVTPAGKASIELCCGYTYAACVAAGKASIELCCGYTYAALYAARVPH
jgi:hypothetical protein